VGKVRFTVVRMEKDMQVTFTIASSFGVLSKTKSFHENHILWMIWFAV